MLERFNDPVVAEIHATRTAMLNAAGDIGTLMQQVAERQRRSKHQIITQPFRNRTEQADAAERRAATSRKPESNSAAG